MSVSPERGDDAWRRRQLVPEWRSVLRRLLLLLSTLNASPGRSAHQEAPSHTEKYKRLMEEPAVCIDVHERRSACTTPSLIFTFSEGRLTYKCGQWGGRGPVGGLQSGSGSRGLGCFLSPRLPWSLVQIEPVVR